jgi:hypothetical protein
VGHLLRVISWSPSMFCICISLLFSLPLTKSTKICHLTLVLRMKQSTVKAVKGSHWAIDGGHSWEFGHHNHSQEFTWAMISFWIKISSGRGLEFIRTFFSQLKP